MALQQMSTSLGRRLRAHRLRAGLTQRQLAERAAMSVRALRDIEQDRAVPRPSSLEQLATALNVSGPDRAELLAALRPGPAQVRPSRMWVGILGPLELRRDDRPVRIASSMQGTLLGLLAVQPGQHLAVDEIIDVLWGDAAPPSSRRLVHTYVGQVRTLLEPGRAHGADDHPLRLVHGGYRLDLDQGQSELCTFDRLTAQATRARVGGDLQAALEFLAGALECWRGPVLAGSGGRLRHHPAAVAAAGRRVAAALAFGDLALELGCYADAVARLRPVLHGEPLHEGLAARLMLALAGCGAQAAALALFHDVRTRLADELAIEPSPELRAAHLRVLRGQTSATGPQRHLPATARGHPPRARTAAPQRPPAAARDTGAATARRGGIHRPDGAPPTARRVAVRIPATTRCRSSRRSPAPVASERQRSPSTGRAGSATAFPTASSM
jgi:DNA-binding SARP family transcriptional activator/DNA-binding XRE family transcriptional regulator